MKTIKVRPGKIGRKKCLQLIFKYDQEIIRLIKSFPGSYWQPEFKCWSINLEEGTLNRLVEVFSGFVRLDLEEIIDPAGRLKGKETNSGHVLKPLDEDDNQRVKKLREWMVHQRYSSSTVRTYCEIITTYLKFINPQKANEDINDLIIRFTNGYIIAKKLSFSYQNQAINALKLFYLKVHKQSFKIDFIERPRREYKLPNVLSKEEVKLLLGACKNKKHKVMLCLIYACGLRSGELLKLTLNDIDSKRKLLLIRNAKGNKDRIAPLPDTITELLRDYYKEERPERWLFEGEAKGSQYTRSSIQKVMKKAVRLAGIKKPVTLHWLRHSYATHLLEGGVNLRYIQEILGHKSSKTTEIYTHVSTKSIQNIQSPFDTL